MTARRGPRPRPVRRPPGRWGHPGRRRRVRGAQGVGVEVVPEGGRRGNVQLRDLPPGQDVENGHRGTQGVAVRDDQHHGRGAQSGSEHVRPVRSHPGGHVGEALHGGHDLRRQGSVAGVGPEPGQLVYGQGPGTAVRRPPQPVEPAGADLREDLALPPSGQRPVLALVEPSGPPDRDPLPVQSGEHDVGAADRAGQDRGVDGLRQQTVTGEQFARRQGLFTPPGGQGHVRPAGEAASTLAVLCPWRTRTRLLAPPDRASDTGIAPGNRSGGAAGNGGRDHESSWSSRLPDQGPSAARRRGRGEPRHPTCQLPRMRRPRQARHSGAVRAVRGDRICSAE